MKKKDVAKIKIYIAGKITDEPDYKTNFQLGANKFPNHIILMPSVLPEKMTRADYMRICFAMIDSADKVAFLPNWKESPGAQVEHEYCRYIGKVIIYL